MGCRALARRDVSWMNSLEGTLPTEIGELTAMTTLYALRSRNARDQPWQVMCGRACALTSRWATAAAAAACCVPTTASALLAAQLSGEMRLVGGHPSHRDWRDDGGP